MVPNAFNFAKVKLIFLEPLERVRIGSFGPGGSMGAAPYGFVGGGEAVAGVGDAEGLVVDPHPESSKSPINPNAIGKTRRLIFKSNLRGRSERFRHYRFNFLY